MQGLPQNILPSKSLVSHLPSLESIGLRPGPMAGVKIYATMKFFWFANYLIAFNSTDLRSAASLFLALERTKWRPTQNQGIRETRGIYGFLTVDSSWLSNNQGQESGQT
jgi:hypothetical protein